MEAPGRRLIWVPIVHTEADLGSLADAVRDAYVARQGAEQYRRHRQRVERFWQRLRETIDRRQFDLDKLRLYQDGLPVAGPEIELRIVTDLARQGHPNHVLLRDLIDRGATLMGTESPELLQAEYELSRRVARGEVPSATAAAELLARRDAFITERIAATLQPTETALLFLGALHQLGTLPCDFAIERLTE